MDTSGTLGAPLASLTLGAAAVLGNIVNYSIGRAIGPPAFSGRYRLLKVEYLRRTEDFFRRHGALAIVLSRFMPIIRTCAPFVAGIARMPYGRFLAYNLAGGFGWVLLFVWGGYLFGNIPLVKQHFGLVTLLIIALSLLPLARRAAQAPGTHRLKVAFSRRRAARAARRKCRRAAVSDSGSHSGRSRDAAPRRPSCSLGSTPPAR